MEGNCKTDNKPCDRDLDFYYPGCSRDCPRNPYYEEAQAEAQAKAEKEAAKTAAWDFGLAFKETRYNGVKIINRRDRDDEGVFGPIATADVPVQLETCPICGQTDTLTEYEGLKICQTCLEGLVEGGGR